MAAPATTTTAKPAATTTLKGGTTASNRFSMPTTNDFYKSAMGAAPYLPLMQQAPMNPFQTWTPEMAMAALQAQERFNTQFGVAQVLYKSNPWPIYEDETLTKEVGETPFMLGSLRFGYNF